MGAGRGGEPPVGELNLLDDSGALGTTQLDRAAYPHFTAENMPAGRLRRLSFREEGRNSSSSGCRGAARFGPRNTS